MIATFHEIADDEPVLHCVAIAVGWARHELHMEEYSSL